jgi:cytochrome c2
MKVNKGLRKIKFIVFSFFMVSIIHPYLVLSAEGDVYTLDEPRRGWKIFYEKGCINCHALWNIGIKGGSDLTGLSFRELIAGYKKHALQKGLKMGNKKFLSIDISPGEIPALVSFLKFVSILDGPGNPDRGERVLTEKNCNSCHSRIAPNLKEKAKFANPVSWIAQMWNHAPKMKREMSKKNIPWPRFDGDNLIDLMAYIRKLSPPREKVYLTLGNFKEGERVIRQNTCLSCHSIFGKGENTGPELTLISQINKRAPRTLGQVAGLMWNHFPEMEQEMKNRGIAPVKLSERDMSNITAYLLSIQRLETESDIVAIKNQP